MHHEMAASIAAEGYARASNNIGVAMATSGPGATNMITGIASCFFDSIPCLFITGQVNTYEFKFNKPVRQIGFQEADIVHIVEPITKKALLITNEEKIRYALEELFFLASQGRPGPVLLDIPLNIQRAEIDPTKLPEFSIAEGPAEEISAETIDQLVSLLSAASRPIILAGGGVRLAQAQEQLAQFVRKTHIPVVTSLMGLDAFAHDDPSYIGMIGTYGNRYANLAVANSDLLLALGTRFDTRQTGTKPETFARKATIVHVDIDPAELNNKVQADYPIHMDIKRFLELLNGSSLEVDHTALIPWKKHIQRCKIKYPAYVEPTAPHIVPGYFISKLSRQTPDDAVICLDVGQIQMWTAQTFEVRRQQRILTEGGMASMGCALPLAIGASFAKPDHTIVAITGDGGFQLNIQELQTLYHHQLPVKIVLLNNNCYGMIRQFQQQYLDGRFQSSVIGYSAPDFQDVVRSYKIRTFKITRNSEIDHALNMLFDDKQPALLEVEIDMNCSATPKLSVNKPVEDQEPLLTREELRAAMFVDILQDEYET
jgi:acetolactate synthase-1/2/3 large subunit